MLSSLVQLLFMILFAILVVNVIYLLVFAVAGRLRGNPSYLPVSPHRKIAIIIPSYKEDNVILQTARRAREHDYPAVDFEVFVAADGLQPETLEQLRSIPVQVAVMDFKGKSSKAKSLNSVLNRIPPGKYDIALILDGDNVMMPGCLEKVNAAFHAGFRCVQLHRTAKNSNNDIAVLDGISEEINNNIFRNGQRALGFTSCTIGSGMAFEFETVRSIFNRPSILDNPGEDREVDMVLVQSGIVIEYIPDGYVLDEKVSSGPTFERQRTRWMEAQLSHIRLLFSRENFKGRKDRDFWNKLVLNLLLPRVLLLAVFFLVFCVAGIFYFFHISLLQPAAYWWLVLFSVLIASLLLSVPGKYYGQGMMLRSMRRIFVIMIRMIRALFKLNPDRREFIHTPKSFTEDVKEMI